MKLSEGYGPRLVVATTFSSIGFIIRWVYFQPAISPSLNGLLFVVNFAGILLLLHLFSLLNRQLDRILPFETATAQRIALQLGIGLLFIVLLRYLLGYWAESLFAFHYNSITNGLLTGLSIFLAFSLNLGVISQYVVNRWKDSLTKAAMLEKETAELRYGMLKDQVNPHFLFNAFSSIQALIQLDPKVASDYVQNLAEVYRYHLERDKQSLVEVEQEWKMILQYVKLLETRYESGIKFELPINQPLPAGQIPVLSLRMLIDNAIKHNEVYAENPLIIEIIVSEKEIQVINTINPKNQLTESHQQGLVHLSSLLNLYDQTLTFGPNETGNYWVVRVPVIKG
jgi:sensor histidine kinase YesM